MQPEVTTLLLAAGLSRRMGPQNKLLLPVGGVPMICHVVAAYSEVTDGDVLVVTGHDRAQVEAALKNSRARLVFNADYKDGQSTSVVCGLRLALPSDLLLIGLGDQPLLSADDLRALIASHKANCPDKISIPRRDGTRGNPIIVPVALRARLLDDPKRPGCKQFTREHSEHVQFLELAQPGFFTDVDTPVDYALLDQQIGKAATC